MGLEHAHPVYTPLDPNVKLQKLRNDDSHYEDIERQYPLAIGMLIWAAIAMRPDIAFAVQQLSQFTSHPAPKHWTAIKRVFRYLKGTLDLNIRYNPADFDRDEIVKTFLDSDWGNNMDDRRSVLRYVTMICGGPTTWNSKKRPTVALSSMEAEYMALCHAIREIIWIRMLLGELGHVTNKPTHLITDNDSAILFTKNQVFHVRSKHIDIRHHFVHERLASNEIMIFHCTLMTPKSR